jgi:hypothetical protein
LEIFYLACSINQCQQWGESERAGSALIFIVLEVSCVLTISSSKVEFVLTISQKLEMGAVATILESKSDGINFISVFCLV